MNEYRNIIEILNLPMQQETHHIDLVETTIKYELLGVVSGLNFCYKKVLHSAVNCHTSLHTLSYTIKMGVTLYDKPQTAKMLHTMK